MKLLVLDDKSLGKNVLKKYNEEDIIPYNYDKFKDGEMIVELKKLLDEMMYGMIFIIPFLILKNNS